MADNDNVMGCVVLVVSMTELLVHAISVISMRPTSVEGGSMMNYSTVNGLLVLVL